MCKFVGTRQGDFEAAKYLASGLVNEIREFECVQGSCPTQIGNNISKSGESTQSRALNAWVMDQLEAVQQREHRGT